MNSRYSADAELETRLDKLILMLSGTSLYDSELELQKEKYLSYMENVYKKGESKEHPSYINDKDELLRAGSKMRNQINEFKKKKSIASDKASGVNASPLVVEDQVFANPASSPMRDRALSSFGFDRLAASRPESPAEVSVKLPDIPREFNRSAWSENAELSITVLATAIDVVQRLTTKMNCGRIYADLTPLQQRDDLFDKFMQRCPIEYSQCIVFSDSLLHYCEQFRSVIPSDWLKAKNKALSVYSSMPPLNQEIVQLIQGHMEYLSERFPSQGSRISRSFSKILTTNESDMDFLKKFFLNESITQ
eukprot:NODE_10_length_47437_cov_0.363429.p13 type:complete len:306 gc:universal NODE_10_length_47437_cov_0.363429:43942-44859(+)